MTYSIIFVTISTISFRTKYTMSEIRGNKLNQIIELKNITQSYNKEIILQDLTLSVSQNQSIAFTGHNGCGKSTLLKLIAGLIRPTHGDVLYHGSPLFHYVPERFPKMNLTARQYLRHMGYLDGLSADDVKTRYETLCEEFFLSDMLDIPMKHLSKGTLQKVSVIQALLKTPDVLILDEPLSGQDTDSQDVFIQKINELRRAGMTILMSCHEQYLIDSISDTVYQIERKHLSLAASQLNMAEKHYILWFDKKEGAEIPDLCAGRIKSCCGKYRIEVKESESNPMIACMIREGWLLRRMEDADY